MNTDALLLLVLIFVPIGLFLTVFIFRNAQERWTTTFRIIQKGNDKFFVEQKKEIWLWRIRIKSYYTRLDFSYTTFIKASEAMEQRRTYMQSEIERLTAKEILVYSDEKKSDYPKYK